ncbi:MAG: TIGR03564 family F420-dependent LLM class oxidoreductase [bacterium]|nr:LLM class F420-dependent oxidoreductase [Deltaproteobacteria bacterium]MCP4903826.1 TIGR03564 family F420-dependent LLM class oxidoreductase [bacterium]
MRIGLFISSVGKDSLDAMVADFVAAETLGFDTAWAGHTFDWDALTLLALAGRSTRRIELGSWVVPSFPRHPVALAGQALTTQGACADRLALGIGVSHAAVIEKRMGIGYTRPLRHMREMLGVLPSLLSGEETNFEGEAFRIVARLDPIGAAAPPVILAALGPRMLELAGRSADGVAIWLGGARFLADFALARIDAGAKSAGRARPRVIVGLPVSVTLDPSAREAAERFLGPSSKLPAYRKVLEREGLESAGAAALIGDEKFVLRRLEELAELGVTDFNAIQFGIRSDPEALQRTRQVLSAFAAGRL